MTNFNLLETIYEEESFFKEIYEFENERFKKYKKIIFNLMKHDNFTDLAVIFRIFVAHNLRMSKKDITCHKINYIIDQISGNRIGYTLQRYFPNREILTTINKHKDIFIRLEDYYILSPIAIDALYK